MILLIVVGLLVVVAGIAAWRSEAQQPKVRSARYGIEEDNAGIDTDIGPG